MPPRKKTKSVDFEKSLKELETIVQQLEEEEIPLAKSLELFERGQKLWKTCEKSLREAENQVRMLIDDENGELEEVAFEGDAEDAKSNPAATADTDEDGHDADDGDEEAVEDLLEDDNGEESKQTNTTSPNDDLPF